MDIYNEKITMTKIKMTESELINLINRVINEQDTVKDQGKGYEGNAPTADEWDNMSVVQKKAWNVDASKKGDVKGEKEDLDPIAMHGPTVKYVKLGGDTLTREVYSTYLKKPPFVKNLVILKPMVKSLYQQVESIFTKCKKGCNDKVEAQKLMRSMKRFSKYFGTDLSTIDNKSLFFPNNDKPTSPPPPTNKQSKDWTETTQGK